MYFCISAFVTLAHVGSNLKSLNHEINFKEKIGPKNYSREKISDPRILTRKFWTHEIPTRKKLWTHEIPTRKNFRPTKYSREKSWTHEIPTKARWHDGNKPTRPTTSRDPRNLAHSLLNIYGRAFFEIIYDISNIYGRVFTC